MKRRGLASVIIFSIITLGIYNIFWAYLTAKEMRTKGANIPHFILYFIPFANYYWMYRYSMAIEQVSNGKMSGVLVFIMFFFTGIGGTIVAQIGMNDAIEAESAAPATGATGNTTGLTSSTSTPASPTPMPYSADPASTTPPEQVMPTNVQPTPSTSIKSSQPVNSQPIDGITPAPVPPEQTTDSQ